MTRHMTTEQMRLYRARPEVRERELARRKTPEYRARMAELRRMRSATPGYRDKQNAGARAGYQRYKAACWKIGNPAYQSAALANKRAKRWGVLGVLTEADVSALWNRQPICVSCGRGRGLDHIIPFVRGGPNHPDNLQNLCGPCNEAKGTRIISPTEIRRAPFDADDEFCGWGHPRATSMHVQPSGQRNCLPCRHESQRRYRQRRRERRLAA